MQWDDVRMLLALLRATNLQEAAVRIGVDRSTISRRLAALEASLGEKLFVRTRDGLRPTSAVERIRPHAERMELEAARVKRAAAATDRGVEGVVRVATTEALGALLISAGLLSVCDEHPRLRIEIATGNKPVDLTRGEADLALRLAALRQPSLRVRRIARIGLGLFASREYVRARGAASIRGSFAGHDVILPSGELSRLPEARWLASRKGARVAFCSNSMPALVAAALAGRGIVPLGLGWGDREPGLHRVAVLTEIPPRSIWLVSPAGEARPAAQVVSDRIARIAAETFAPKAR
jgi:DNA-binding transcriptional LysR family regulator